MCKIMSDVSQNVCQSPNSKTQCQKPQRHLINKKTFKKYVFLKHRKLLASGICIQLTCQSVIHIKAKALYLLHCQASVDKHSRGDKLK